MKLSIDAGTGELRVWTGNPVQNIERCMVEPTCPPQPLSTSCVRASVVLEVQIMQGFFCSKSRNLQTLIHSFIHSFIHLLTHSLIDSSCASS